MRLIEKYEKLTSLTQSLRDQGNDETYIKQVVSMINFNNISHKTLLSDYIMISVQYQLLCSTGKVHDKFKLCFFRWTNLCLLLRNHYWTR